MRICHTTSVDRLIHAEAGTVVDEFLSVRNATEHEFRSEAERSRYADLVRAWGLFAHGQRFLTILSERFPQDKPVTPICARCGSDSLVRDASARWDVDAQEWSVSGVYDSTYCDDCESESDTLCEWIPVGQAGASALEPCIGARVRILERPRVGRDRFRNREGVIVKTHFAGFYVKLDLSAREKTQKTELVETGYLEVLAAPESAPSADPALACDQGRAAQPSAAADSPGFSGEAQ